MLFALVLKPPTTQNQKCPYQMDEKDSEPKIPVLAGENNEKLNFENLKEEKDEKKPCSMELHVFLKALIVFALLSGLIILVKNTWPTGRSSSQKQLDLLRIENDDKNQPLASSELVRKVQKLRENKSESENSLCLKFDPEAVPRSLGMYNTGNTCFFLAFMQVFYHNRSLRRLVSRLSTVNLMALKLSNLFAYMDSVEPNSLVDPQIASFLPSYFLDRQQHDSAEALDSILNEMVDDEFVLQCESHFKYIFAHKKPTTSFKADPMNILPLGIDCTAPSAAPYKSKVNKKKNRRSRSKSTIMPQLPQENPCQFQTLVENFFKPETISPESSQRSTEGMQDIIKHYKIIQHPKTLIVQLKRFEFTFTTGLKKNLTPIYNSELVTLPGGVKYHLKAVVYHSGDITRGHYVALVRNADTATFTLFNDSSVSQVSDVSKYLDNGYVYFYERIDES